jgi:hypothetical protein
MATLQQTLRGLPQADDQLTRGPGGVLQKKKPTLQQAAQQAGVQAPPTTPLGAEMIGASPDAAKMAGTPQSLQTALRTKQFNRAATAEEQEAMTKSPELQKLGGLGDRVQQMVDTQAAKFAPPKPTTAAGGTTTTTQPAVSDVTAGVAKTYGTTDLAPITADLEIVRNNPNSQAAMDAMVRINKHLGRDINTVMDPTEFNKLYQSSQEAISGAVKEAVIDPTTIKLTDFLGKDKLDYDTATLAGLLNVTEQELSGYSVQQLQDKLKEEVDKEYSRTKELEQMATSPLGAGQAERQLAREAARELSTTGVRASESQMQNLLAEVSKADQVQFLGKSGTVSELLSDDNVSAVIKEIVESPADSDIRKQMASDPASKPLYDFITRNENALKVAASKIQTGATSFKTLQEENKKTIEALGISADLAGKLAPDTAGLRSTKIDTKAIPIFDYLTSVPPENKQIVSDQLDAAVSSNLVSSDELKGLTKDELTALGIGKVDGNWDKLLKTRTNRKNFENAGSPEEQLKHLSGTGVTIPQATRAMADADTLKKLGLPITVDFSAYDVNGDGKPDWDKLDQVYNKFNPPQSLKDAAKSVNSTVTKPLTIPSMSKDTLNNTYLTTDQARAVEALYKDPNKQIPIDPIIITIVSSKQGTAGRLNAEISKPGRTTKEALGRSTNNSARDASVYQPDRSNAFIAEANKGQMTDKAVVKQKASEWVTSLDWPRSGAGPQQQVESSTLVTIYKDLKRNGLLTEDAERRVREKLVATTDPKWRAGYDADLRAM